MSRTQICAQESEGRAKSESAKEREMKSTPRTRARAHTHMRARILARAHGLNSRKDTRVHAHKMRIGESLAIPIRALRR